MDLKFDAMAVDTTLAQDFLKNERRDISLLTSLEFKGFDGDQFFDEAYLLRYGSENGCSSSKLRKLAVLLKENSNLFAQLEYLTRKIPFEDTKTQINIIVQQLYYVSSCINDASPTKPYDPKSESQIYFQNEASILNLGFVARLMERNARWPSIIAQSQTVGVTYLFSKLCYKAGLVVMTVYEADCLKKDYCGCVGVISEDADVDSAVDVFLSSTTCQQVPWKLKRLLVQESVYQQFKDSLSWKCSLNKTGEARSTNTSTSDVLEYNGRSFLIDSIAVSDPLPDQVTVEAYRTRKELITLLNDRQLTYLSLWANDIAGINEITHSIATRVTWVNNFGDFRGPPKISEALYANSLNFDSIRIGKSDKLCELYKLQRSWLNLTIEARRVVLYNTLAKFLAGITNDQRGEEFYTDLKVILDQLEVSVCSGFVNVDKEYVCVGVPTHYDKLFLWQFDLASAAFFKFILYGNAFALKSSCCPELINVFKNAGIPVIELKIESGEGNQQIYLSKFLENITDGLDQAYHVIWSNSGTIFAN